MDKPLQEDKESMPLLTKTKTTTNTKIGIALAFLGGALAFAGATLATRPDLAVQSVTFDPATRMPTVVVINRGSAAVPAPRAGGVPPSVAVQWLRSDGTSFSARADLSGGIPALAPSRTQTYSFTSLGNAPSDAIRARVTVDFYRNVDESDENNNIWEGELPALPLPDLAVQTVNFDPVTRVPTITILNQGTLGMPPITTPPPEMLVEWLGSEGGSLGRFAVGIPQLASRATQTYFDPGQFTPPAGAIRLRLTVDRSLDGTARLAESNEANNVWEGAVPLPDLIPQSVTFNPATHLPIVQVLNQGNFSAVWTATTSFQTIVQWLPATDNARFSPNTILGTSTAVSPSGTLAASAVLEVSSFDRMRASFVWADVRRARVIIDAVRPGILESNETNNTWEGEVPPPPAPALPDLHNIFERLPDTPTEGSPFTLRVRVQNLGTGAAGTSVSSLQLDRGNDGTIDTTFPTRDIPAIAAGATSAPVEWTWSAWPAGGPHRLVMCADSGSAVAESDETNNCTTMVIAQAPSPIGNLTVSLDADTPLASLVALGTTNVPMLKVKFTASREPFFVRRIRVINTAGMATFNGPTTAANATADSMINRIIVSYPMQDGATASTVGALVGGTASINLPSSAPMYIGVDQTKTMTVSADIADVSQITGRAVVLTPRFGLDFDSNFQALGAGSAITLNSSSGAAAVTAGVGFTANTTPDNADVVGNEMRVVKAIPVVALSVMSPSGGTTPGNNETLIYTVSNSGTTDIELSKITFKVNSTCNSTTPRQCTATTGWNKATSSTASPIAAGNGVASMDPSDFTLYEGSAVGSARGAMPTAGTWTLWNTLGQRFTSSTQVGFATFYPTTVRTIAAGASKTFIVKVDSSGATSGSSRDTLRLDIMDDTSGLLLATGIAGSERGSSLVWGETGSNSVSTVAGAAFGITGFLVRNLPVLGGSLSF